MRRKKRSEADLARQLARPPSRQARAEKQVSEIISLVFNINSNDPNHPGREGAIRRFHAMMRRVGRAVARHGRTLELLEKDSQWRKNDEARPRK